MKIILLSILMGVTLSAQAANPWLVKKIVFCESNGHHLTKSGKFNCGDDNVSCGIAQFRKETFYEFAAQSIRDRTWPFKRPFWFSKSQQLFLLSWGLDHGYANRWTCYRKTMANLRNPMDSDHK
jgi:hypothetical protein